MMCMHDAEIAKARGQVSAGDTCAVAIVHGVHEQSVVFCSGSRMYCLAW